VIARKVQEEADLVLSKANQSASSAEIQSKEIRESNNELIDSLNDVSERVAAQELEIERLDKLQHGLLERIRTEGFPINDLGRVAVIAPPLEGAPSLVAMKLEAKPIVGSVSIQWHVFAQPPKSFHLNENIVFFRWGDPLEKLNDHQLFVSYFADNTAEPKFSKVELVNDSIVADGVEVFNWNIQQE